MSIVPRAWQSKTAVTMTEQKVQVADGEVPAKLFVPESGHGGGIVIVQEIFGVSNYIQQRAADLADEGWTVLVPNLYWRVGGAVVSDDDPDALPKAMELMSANPWDETVSDIRACIAALRSHAETGGRVAVMGFCYGGGLAYAAASGAQGAELPDALVSYYGSALPQLVDTVPVVDVCSLHHFGEKDAYIPFDQVRHIAEVVTTGQDCEFCSWPGAGHAFDNPNPLFHHAVSSEGAWETTLTWLYEHFPAEPVR